MGFNNSTSVKIYLRLAEAARPYYWAFSLSVLGNLLMAGIDGLLAYCFKPLINTGFIEQDKSFIRLIPLAIVGLFVLRGLAYFLANYFMAWVGRSVVRDFRCRMINHLMRLPQYFFDHESSGRVLSKINYDTAQVAEAISEAVTSTIRGAFTTISLLTVMFMQNWRITLILLVTLPLLAIYINKISKKMRRFSTEIQASLGEVTHVASEIINGVQVVKTFAGYDYEINRFKQAANHNFTKELKLTATAATSVSIMQLIGVIALVIFVYLATLGEEHFLGTHADAGVFVSMVTALMGLLRPIKQIAVVNSILQRGVSGATSIFSLLDTPLEPDSGKLLIDKTKGALSIRNLSFSYQNEAVLKEINLDIKAGETIALVGASGSGKSTLVSLLLRFYNYHSGNITLDGIDIREYNLDALRRQFAVVTQNIVLFNDTILNNIAYGTNQEANEEKITAVINQSHASDFIQRLPEGLHTIIGENGANLSGGQRQRLSIARALLKDAPIMIFDEATSALDNESEYYVQQALNSVLHQKTTIIIAHRLSTVEKADRVVVLEKGLITAIGTPEEILPTLYNKHYELQI